MSWENYMDNTVHAHKSYKSVSRKSLLVTVRLAKGRRVGVGGNANFSGKEWVEITTSEYGNEDKDKEETNNCQM